MAHKGCVRLYSLPNCFGDSFETSNNQKELTKNYFDDEARSISSCKRPKPEYGCVVHVLFSLAMDSTEILLLVNKILTESDKLFLNVTSSHGYMVQCSVHLTLAMLEREYARALYYSVSSPSSGKN